MFYAEVTGNIFKLIKMVAKIKRANEKSCFEQVITTWRYIQVASDDEDPIIVLPTLTRNFFLARAHRITTLMRFPRRNQKKVREFAQRTGRPSRFRCWIRASIQHSVQDYILNPSVSLFRRMAADQPMIDWLKHSFPEYINNNPHKERNKVVVDSTTFFSWMTNRLRNSFRWESVIKIMRTNNRVGSHRIVKGKQRVNSHRKSIRQTPIRNVLPGLWSCLTNDKRRISDGTEEEAFRFPSSAENPPHVQRSKRGAKPQGAVDACWTRLLCLQTSLHTLRLLPHTNF